MEPTQEKLLSTNLNEQNLHLRNTVTFLWKQNQLQKAQIATLENYLRDYINEMLLNE